MCGIVLMLGLLVVALLWSLGGSKPKEGFQSVSRRGVAFDPNWKAPWAPALGPEEIVGAPALNALAWSKETLPAAMPVPPSAKVKHSSTDSGASRRHQEDELT